MDTIWSNRKSIYLNVDDMVLYEVRNSVISYDWKYCIPPFDSSINFKTEKNLIPSWFFEIAGQRYSEIPSWK